MTWQPGDRVSEGRRIAREGFFQLENAFTEHVCTTYCSGRDAASWPEPQGNHDLFGPQWKAFGKSLRQLGIKDA